MAFLAVGIFVTFGIYNSFADVFERASAIPQSQSLLTIGGAAGSYETWAALPSLHAFHFVPAPSVSDRRG
jgi:hypothetical protein